VAGCREPDSGLLGLANALKSRTIPRGASGQGNDPRQLFRPLKPWRGHQTRRTRLRRQSLSRKTRSFNNTKILENEAKETKIKLTQIALSTLLSTELLVVYCKILLLKYRRLSTYASVTRLLYREFKYKHELNRVILITINRFSIFVSL
jgi:hypothetical protein